MNKLSLVFIEKSTCWHVTVWEKKLFVPVLLEEKNYDKLIPNELIPAVFNDLQQKYSPIHACTWHICLDPKNVIIKEWEFPFSASAKIKKAIDIMLDAEMPQANLLTHTTIINKKDKQEKSTKAYTLSCLTAFLSDWYTLLEKYYSAETNITFLPFPYFIGQQHTEEKVYLSLYEETFFSITYKKNNIKKIQYIQLVKNELNNKYVNAALNLILPKANNTEFVIINDNKQELKEYLSEDAHYTPYNPIQKFQAPAQFIRKNFLKKSNFTGKPIINSIESIIAYNILVSYDKKSLFFTRKNKRQAAEKTNKSRLMDKLLSPAYIPGYLILFCLFLGLNSMLVDYINLKQENTSYLNEMQRIYKQAVPDAPYFSNFKQLKSVILNRISPESAASQHNTPLAVLEFLSTLFPDNQKILIKNFNINKNSVTISADTINYEELDKIQKVLNTNSQVSNVKITNASILKEQKEFTINFEMTFNFEE